MMEEKIGIPNKKKSGSNKFVRLLVLLGMIFFLYIMQDIFHIKVGKEKAMVETEDDSKGSLAMGSMSSPNSQQVVSELQSEVKLVLEEEEGWGLGQMGASLKEVVGRKIGEFQPKIQQFCIPRHLLSSMMQAKSCI